LLIDNLGGGEAALKKMKNTSGWNEDGNGTNTSGFTALPGGYRDGTGLWSSNSFGNAGAAGYFWSTTEISIENAQLLFVTCGLETVFLSAENKEIGFSVRCLRD
jgi:uncharacterized protein (TIGR02145 family)